MDVWQRCKALRALGDYLRALARFRRAGSALVGYRVGTYSRSWEA